MSDRQHESAAPLRRGWCPGALRPMAARDGLLVRLRLTAGLLAADHAAALADLAERDGSGIFEITARANLQMRGASEGTLVRLQAALRDLDLLDTDQSAEAVRNVLVSPLAGLGASSDGPDGRVLARALENMLVATARLHELPAKFGFLIDDGSAPGLAGSSADVRFDWHRGEGCFAIGLGGTRRGASFAGRCTPGDLVERAHAIADWVVSAQTGPVPRRMAALLAARHEGAPMSGTGAAEPAPVWPDEADLEFNVGQQTIAGLPVLALAAPFGRFDAAMVRRVARCAQQAGGELRLTPWRMLLVPGATIAACDTAGFITDPTDPRLRVATCIGAEGCAQGTTPTLRDAADLAPFAASLGTAPVTLHLSGCVKGCAKASPTTVTLVGANGLYDLVIGGRAGDPPHLRGLDLPACRAALSARAA